MVVCHAAYRLRVSALWQILGRTILRIRRPTFTTPSATEPVMAQNMGRKEGGEDLAGIGYSSQRQRIMELCSCSVR